MANYRIRSFNGKCIGAHRLAMEKHLGRKLTSNEVVHHIDWDRYNNEISNLELMDKTEHNRLSGRKNLTGAKLTKEDILIIRKMLHDKIRQWLIALIYNVSQNAISSIRTGKTWSWL